MRESFEKIISDNDATQEEMTCIVPLPKLSSESIWSIMGDENNCDEYRELQPIGSSFLNTIISSFAAYLLSEGCTDNDIGTTINSAADETTELYQDE